MTTCERCTEDRHIDCDGTVQAPDSVYFDPCPCDCNPYTVKETK